MIQIRTKLFFVLILSLFLFPSPALPANVCTPTQNDVEGPYYLPDAPFRTDISTPDEPGEQLVIRGTVLEPDCSTPIKGALIEVWQTDTNGKYYYRDEGYRLRGQLKVSDEGTYAFRTVKPGRYKIMNGFRPAHIHLKISHPKYKIIITQLYFQGDPYIAPNDACGSGCRSNDPKRIVGLKENSKKGYLEGTFPIYLEKK